MSRVQAVERAFAVLAALADGPIGVTEVADRVHLPKSTVARLLRALQHEGAVEQVPGDTRYRVGERMALLAARLTPGASLVSLARPTLEELAAEVGEAAGLGVPGRLPGPLHRPGRHLERGPGPRLDGHARPDACGPVRPGACSPSCPAPEFARFLGSTARAVHAEHDHRRGRAAGPAGPDPGRGRRLGPRGVRRGHQLGGRRRAGRGWPAGRRDPRPRSRRTASRRPATRPAISRLLRAAAGRISASLSRAPERHAAGRRLARQMSASVP